MDLYQRLDLFERLAGLRERWNVLRHPFYRRWSAGELDAGELAFYAGEYRHAVVALAAQSRAAAQMAEPDLRPELERHANEEAAHIDLWDDFARAFEADLEREPLPETASCAEAWTGGQSVLERLVVLYTIESTQPPISRTKLDGLAAHYGVAPDTRAAGYFALHAERDREHAAQSRRLIARALEHADADRLLELARSALEGSWRLLDGVEAQPASTVG